MGSGKSHPFSFRRGIAAIYSILMLVVLCGMVSMGVDLGRVQLAKTELRAAADGAARAGAAGLAASVTQAKSDAAAVAAANTCDGSAVVIDQTLDIEFGAWDDSAKTFTVLTGSAQNSANAVRITARRIAARNTAIPLVFARLVGRSTCDINAVAIAKVTFGLGRGFVGVNSISVKNNSYWVSYNSAVNANPTLASASSNAIVGTNGVFTADANDHIQGNIQLGSTGSLTGTPQVTGSVVHYTSPLAVPSSPAWSPGSNPGGISQNYTVNSTTTLPGGTYWFTSLDVNKDLTFSGPATVYVNGNVDLDADLRAYNNIPSNLKIYQIGTGRTFGDVGTNNLVVVADVEAPGADFEARNNVIFMGMAVFRTITVKNNSQFFFDEAAGMGLGAKQITLVK
ncbi:MAG TPA: pilus assembly protein TadG-related protein [Tepidisphaeraceae bacterium]|nr:pilus assembly protein TadG-related protein [Tepidisphaeraceae bacterium]